MEPPYKIGEERSQAIILTTNWINTNRQAHFYKFYIISGPTKDTREKTFCLSTFFADLAYLSAHFEYIF